MVKKFNLRKERKALKKRALENHDIFISNIFRLIEEQDKEFIKRLKDYQDKKIELAKKGKEITEGEREAHILCCIDTKMFINEIAGEED